jgi:DNA mismatch endonuclease (patch repair protein)
MMSGGVAAAAGDERSRRTIGPRDPAVTSRMMASVKAKDSRAELALRRAVHAAGVRYRLHARDVFGRPDLVIRAARLAVFVDGDFWHGNAHRLRGLDDLAQLFPTRTEWWVAKITRNVERDVEVTRRLREKGWRVVRLWESDVLADPVAAARHVIAALQEQRCEHQILGGH